ncbi:MAG: hypothetical protein ACI4RA_04645 [Kiritimatiellia bacterium]
MKMGRPSEDTVANALRGTCCVCKAAGIDLDGSITQLTRKAFDAALSMFVERGLTRVTAWSYLCQIRAVFARWCRPYYQEAGWEIPLLDMPNFRAKPPRYERPSSELLTRVKAWYRQLTGEWWFAATMMLEFAMRNGDVLRLGRDNFIARTKGGEWKRRSEAEAVQHYLYYTPHKTALSSGRHVYWPIHEEIWRRYEELGGIDCLDVTDETFDEINHDLRALGFRGNKAAYELRKICIDHVYQKYGAEMAVSISGDDIRTISKYYADPAQPNMGATRIIDLL